MLTDTTRTTEGLLLGINFCINMSLCRQAIGLHKKIETLDIDKNNEESLKKDVITELILNEIIEILVPLAYIGTFLMAYYGPNKELIGNIGITIWKYKKVEGLNSLIAVVEMVLFDSASFILAGLLLRFYCRVNILAEYCKIVKKYWIHLVSHGGTILTCVRIKKIFNYLMLKFLVINFIKSSRFHQKLNFYYSGMQDCCFLLEGTVLDNSSGYVMMRIDKNSSLTSHLKRLI